MTMILYNCSDDNMTVTKTLTNALTVSAVPTAGMSLDTPVVDIAYNTAALNKNYAKLTITSGSPATTKYEAYYFVMPAKELHIGEKITLSLQLDVLMTYSAGIRAAKANVIRSQSRGINVIHDAQLPLLPDQCKKYWSYLKSPFTITPDTYRICLGVFNSQ